MSIFKACDIRGVYGADLTDAISYTIGRAIGIVVMADHALVAGDGRTSTPAVKSALAAGLLDAGVDVSDAGIMPTPVFHHACRALKAPVGVMVTASHNPARYNGLKISVGGEPISASSLAGIERAAASDEPSPGRRGAGVLVALPGCLEQYAADRTAQGEGIAGLSVVIDGGNGVMGPMACRVMGALGARVVPLFCEVDGSFPNRSPNPADSGALAALAARATETGADLGVAFDGDGDRALFVDNLGRPIPPDTGIVLMARHMLGASTGGAVVYDQKCSAIVPEGVVASGGEPVIERSGYAFMRVRMKASHAVYGGELSGHHFFGDVGYDDGLLAAIRMCQLVRLSGATSAALVDAIPRYATTPDIRVHVEPGQAARILDDLRAGLAGEAEISTMDGVMARFADGWALARESVTEPVVTFRMEGRTPTSLDRIVKRIQQLVPQLPGDLV